MADRGAGEIGPIFTWQVEATTPGVYRHPTTGEERPQTQNLWLQVIASTLEKATGAVRERYPEVTFIKVMRDRQIKDVILSNEVADVRF